MQQDRRGARSAVVIIVGILTLLVLGTGSIVSYSKEQNLQSQLAAVPYVPLFDSYGLPAQHSDKQRAWQAERQSLEREIFHARQTTERWLNFLGGFVVVAVLLIAAYVAVAGIHDGVRDLARRAAERRASNAEPLISKIAGAAGAMSKAMPRQPTIGGGRLSTADELRKWAALRDEGLISEEEFNRMRERLLG